MLDYGNSGSAMAKEFLVSNAAFSSIIGLYIAGFQRQLLEVACLAVALLLCAMILRSWDRIHQMRHSIILTTLNLAIAAALIL